MKNKVQSAVILVGAFICVAVSTTIGVCIIQSICTFSNAYIF